MDLQRSETIDAALASVGHKSLVAGVVSSALGWLLSSQGAALVGIFGVVCGLLMQFYFRRRQDRREQAEYELRMERAREKP